MSADVSLVLVAYRSSAAAPAAVASFRAEAARLGVSSEVILVDHSEDPNEAAGLEALAPDRLLERPNRGYAAGVNAGFAASAGRTVLAGNPDITFQEGSVAALLAALDEGWDIVGPQFTLAGLLFPPSDLQTPGEQLRRWLASRSRMLWDRELRHELERWRLVWDATAAVPVPTLSGALLAFRRETFERVGPWDEGYFLYFEETDWLRRAAARGLRLALVPQARVVHAWGHSTDPEASSGYFAASMARFFSAHFGWRGRLAQRLRLGPAPLHPTALPAETDALPRQSLWWLLSPTGLGFPAAGLLGTAQEFTRGLPGVGAARGGSGHYLALATDPEAGRLVGEWSWEARDG
jgi:GT2 family glycosyltransferase